MDKANGIRPELLDKLLKGVSTREQMFGPDGLLKRLMGKVVERALKAELALATSIRRKRPKSLDQEVRS